MIAEVRCLLVQKARCGLIKECRATRLQMAWGTRSGYFHPSLLPRHTSYPPLLASEHRHPKDPC